MFDHGRAHAHAARPTPHAARRWWAALSQNTISFPAPWRSAILTTTGQVGGNRTRWSPSQDPARHETFSATASHSLLDLVVGNYDGLNFGEKASGIDVAGYVAGGCRTHMRSNRIHGGARNELFRNLGGGVFEPVEEVRRTTL